MVIHNRPKSVSTRLPIQILSYSKLTGRMVGAGPTTVAIFVGNRAVAHLIITRIRFFQATS